VTSAGSSGDVTWPLSAASLDWSNPDGDVVPDVTVRPAIDCHPRAQFPTLGECSRQENARARLGSFFSAAASAARRKLTQVVVLFAPRPVRGWFGCFLLLRLS